MSQSLAKIVMHIVFSTKERIQFLSENTRNQLFPYMAICLKNLDCHVHAIGGIEDHVHVLCDIPRTASISKIIEKMKTSSSIFIKQIAQNAENFHWQNGYGVFSVSWSNLQIVTNYILNQREHHKKISFQDELKLLLEKNNISYDERYLWN